MVIHVELLGGAQTLKWLGGLQRKPTNRAFFTNRIIGRQLWDQVHGKPHS
jgi:hypothetical protein